MTGPEHYREAERLTQLAIRQYEKSREDEVNPLWQLTMQQAQVDATLALAAATLEAATDLTPTQEFTGNGNYLTQGVNAKAWREVLA